MYKKTVLFVALAFLLMLSSKQVLAQVTIGSGIAPRAGALLDLKDREDSTTGTDERAAPTANRGLGLPRVNLTSKQNLYPMFKKGDASYLGQNKADEDEAHIGLLVYHVQITNNPANEDDLTSGLYVWDGKMWTVLGAPVEVFNSDDGTVKGKSGTIYKTRKFGEAGEWMVENLRETEYDAGEPATRLPIEKLNGTHDFGVASYYYPNMSKELYLKHPEYGLLYSLVGATNGRVTDRPGYTETSGRVQGICPTGWVVPSRLDWRNLRKELEAHPEKYSVNEDGRQIGFTSKSPMKVEGSKSEVKGASRSNGFNALMVGTIRNKNSNDYGVGSSFWSSSVISDEYAYHRELYNDYGYSVKDESHNLSTNMYSVRCLKRIYKEQQ